MTQGNGTIEVRFTQEKTTKNTVRFAEQTEPGNPPVIGTLYLQEYAVERLGNPNSLIVSVRAS